MDATRSSGSFRDPGGALFERDGILYRRVDVRYREHYARLIDSGLYARAVEKGLLLPHEEVDLEAPGRRDRTDRVLQPAPLAFVSYPYEWCFSQLKDAALLTLRLQRLALSKGMGLKDASAYNVQFHRGRPLFVDSLSFEIQRGGRPWPAYRQFCEHFLAPLALMAYVHPDLARLLRVHLDGVPLGMASRMLPRRTLLRFSLLSHLHLHARSQRVHAGRAGSAARARAARVSGRALDGLLESLERAVRRLRWRPSTDALDPASYGGDAFAHKVAVVGEWIDAIRPRSAWDLGAGSGRFSRLLADRGIETVAFDVDAAVVEAIYREGCARGERRLLPLVMDLTNPSPNVGWEHAERMSLRARAPADLVLALALVHHLAIGRGVPLPRIASFLHPLCRHLLIEFVPKDDPQVQRLLATREDVFGDYQAGCFEACFADRFVLRRREAIKDSRRVLYWFEAR